MRIIILLLLFCLLPAAALAATEHTQVLAVQGKVQCLMPGETQAVWLAAGDAVPYGSMVRTGSGAVELLVPDAGRVRLHAEAQATIVADGGGHTLWLDAGMAQQLLDLLQGREFTVVTPSVTAGVRGTVFTVAAAADGSAEVAVDTGTVALDSVLSGEAAVLHGGETARAALGETLQPLAGPLTGAGATGTRRKRMALAALAGAPTDTALHQLAQRLQGAARRCAEQVQRYRDLQQQRDRLAATPHQRRQTLRLEQRLAQARQAAAAHRRQLAALSRWLQRQAADGASGETLDAAQAGLRDLQTALVMIPAP